MRYWHVIGHDHTLQPLRRSEAPCQGSFSTARRTNRQRTIIEKRSLPCEAHHIELLTDLVGDRLTVGQRTLTPPVLVRIQVPQPASFACERERISKAAIPAKAGTQPQRGPE